jgi:Recombination directionality factor-like
MSDGISKSGLHEIDPREPIGVVLTVGVKKGGSGYPVEKDRYHLVQPREDNGVRPHHPAYGSFNMAAPEKRYTIRGNIVHASRAEAFEGYLRNQSSKQLGMHPNRRPYCTGDGVHALRWIGDGADDFVQIKCPAGQCEYRLTAPPSCKPFTRLLFRLRWQEGVKLPSMLCKFTSGSWNTTANLMGFFDYIENTARQIGLEHYSLFGFPFILTLTQQTKPSQKSRFPVTTITPEQDPVEFFAHQSEQLRLAHRSNYEALPDLSQQDDLLLYEDVKSIQVPGGSE